MALHSIAIAPLLTGIYVEDNYIVRAVQIRWSGAVVAAGHGEAKRTEIRHKPVVLAVIFEVRCRLLAAAAPPK